MGTKKAYDLSVVVGHYTDGNGAEKNRYQNIGVVLVKDDGNKFILMDRSFNPAGIPYDPSKGNTILVSLFADKGEKKEEPRRQSPYQPDGSPVQKPAQSQPDFIDDVLF